MHFNTSRKPRRGFERFTIADMQTTKCAMLAETGADWEVEGNAGPHVLDYTGMTVKQGTTGTEEPVKLNDIGVTTNETLAMAASREWTWDIADGINMDVNDAAAFPEGQGAGMVEYTHNGLSNHRYVIFDDLTWDIEFAPVTFDDILIYRQLTDPSVDDDGDESFPITYTGDTLQDWLDAQYQPVSEAIPGNDFWSSLAEVFRVPAALTLMRVPLFAGIESVADMNYQQDYNKYRYLLAPTGYLRFKELDDVDPMVTGWDPGNTLEGVRKGDESEQFYDRIYRPWEPYDKLKGVILKRQPTQARIWKAAQSSMQEHFDFDPDDVDHQTMGFPAMPSLQTPRNVKFRGRFSGQITVSARKKWPLVLTCASLPVRLAQNFPVGGGTEIYYYRARLLPVRWHISANVKWG